MTVWILICCDWDDFNILGVYKDKDEADQNLIAAKLKYEGYSVALEEWQVI